MPSATPQADFLWVCFSTTQQPWDPRIPKIAIVRPAAMLLAPHLPPEENWRTSHGWHSWSTRSGVVKNEQLLLWLVYITKRKVIFQLKTHLYFYKRAFYIWNVHSCSKSDGKNPSSWIHRVSSAPRTLISSPQLNFQTPSIVGLPIHRAGFVDLGGAIRAFLLDASHIPL